jgi:hypothetical protein
MITGVNDKYVLVGVCNSVRGVMSSLFELAETQHPIAIGVGMPKCCNGSYSVRILDF